MKIQLSLRHKMLTIFVIQNILILVVAKHYDISYIVFDVGLLFFSTLFINYTYFKNGAVGFIPCSIVFCIYFILNHSNGLSHNFHKEYHELKSYSGISYNAHCKYCSGLLHLNSNDPKMHFHCDLIIKDSCFNEITKYFGADKQYGQNISVKYVEIDYHLPVFIFIKTKEKLIYEIAHDGKVIFSYDYFINKFATEQRNLFIFTVFLILNTIGFCIIYKMMEKHLQSVN